MLLTPGSNLHPFWKSTQTLKQPAEMAVILQQGVSQIPCAIGCWPKKQQKISQPNKLEYV